MKLSRRHALPTAQIKVVLLVPGKREHIGNREFVPIMRLAKSFGWSTRRVPSGFTTTPPLDPNPVIHQIEDGVEPEEDPVEKNADT